jgi:hypothetical protein
MEFIREVELNILADVSVVCEWIDDNLGLEYEVNENYITIFGIMIKEDNSLNAFLDEKCWQDSIENLAQQCISLSAEKG